MAEEFIKGIIRPTRRGFITGAAAVAAAACLPKAADAFFMNGGGAAVPAQSPAQPAAAASYGFNNLAFFDDFLSLSTIDVNNTQNPGYNWYPSWFNFGTASTYTVHPASTFSVNNSILTWNPTNQVGRQGGAFGSAYFNSTTKTFTKGFMTNPGKGFYAEVYMQFGATPGLSNNWFPAFWSWDGGVWVYNSPSTAYGSNRFSELDFMEYQPGYDVQTYDYSSAGTVGRTNTGYPAIADPTAWHKYGMLWAPQNLNGGTGLLQTWVDGVHYSAADVTYSSTTISAKASGGATTGWMSGLDTSALGLMINFQTGYQWPIQVDYVQVWQ